MYMFIEVYTVYSYVHIDLYFYNRSISLKNLSFKKANHLQYPYVYQIVFIFKNVQT